MKIEIIQNKIYEIRGEKVMLDFDIAQLYEVETRVFNQAVKRNIQSFPMDFMFRLTASEWHEISSLQKVMMKDEKKMPGNSSQFVMSSKKHRGAKYLPYVFTEHGVTMVASILKSPKARKMNIAMVRAFIALKKLAYSNLSAVNLLKELRERIDEHDVQLKNIYDVPIAIGRKYVGRKEEERMQKLRWEKRERIGFKK